MTLKKETHVRTEVFEFRLSRVHHVWEAQLYSPTSDASDSYCILIVVID